jgi:DNA-binding transcriptional ArsR family regulator
MSRIAAHADVFQAIADPTRRSILDMLEEEELAVKDLASPFSMSKPALSQHLRVLRLAGLVQERREGRMRIYKLNPKPLESVAGWIKRYDRFWNERLDRLGEHLARKHGDKDRPR